VSEFVSLPQALTPTAITISVTNMLLRANLSGATRCFSIPIVWQELMTSLDDEISYNA
jgi:hypothetical protein